MWYQINETTIKSKQQIQVTKTNSINEENSMSILKKTNKVKTALCKT